jgi:hypothetical protein
MNQRTRREQSRLLMAQRRAREEEAESARRMEVDRVQHAFLREQQSQDQYTARLEGQRHRQEMLREHQSQDQNTARLEGQRHRQEMLREHESQEQHTARLEVNRVQHALLREQQSQDQYTARLDGQRHRQEMLREHESQEQHTARLEVDRVQHELVRIQNRQFRQVEISQYRYLDGPIDHALLPHYDKNADLALLHFAESRGTIVVMTNDEASQGPLLHEDLNQNIVDFNLHHNPQCKITPCMVCGVTIIENDSNSHRQRQNVNDIRFNRFRMTDEEILSNSRLDVRWINVPTIYRLRDSREIYKLNSDYIDDNCMGYVCIECDKVITPSNSTVVNNTPPLPAFAYANGNDYGRPHMSVFIPMLKEPSIMENLILQRVYIHQVVTKVVCRRGSDRVEAQSSVTGHSISMVHDNEFVVRDTRNIFPIPALNALLIVNLVGTAAHINETVGEDLSVIRANFLRNDNISNQIGVSLIIILQ